MNTSSVQQELQMIEAEQDIYMLFGMQDRYEHMHEVGMTDAPTSAELISAVMDRQTAVSMEMAEQYE